MNGRQKIIQQQFLNNEQAVIKRLKQVYVQSLKDINENIENLMARADANSSSVIYQVEYQKAIQGQISGILDTMNAQQFTTVSDYLQSCYEDGYIGTMFDLQGQGVPLVIPMNQEQIVRAVQLDSKISGGMYNRFGEDTKMLKKHITAQVSRGISTGMSFEQVAQQISLKMMGTKYKPGGAYAHALTIARTEGHRIQCQSSYDALFKARDKGANIVKQWDSTLDGLTRPSHRQVDGEIRELEEAFSNGLLFPGDPSGPAAEVICCRCALLQRARWALKETVNPDTGVVEWEDGHFTKWDSGEAKIVDFSGIKEYNTFKQKYLETAKTIPVKNYGCELATKFGNAYYDEVQRLVSSSTNPKAQAVWNKYESQIQVIDAHYTGRAHCSGNAISVNGPNDSKGAKWFAPYQTTFHESGHAIDYMAKKAPNIPNPSTSWGSRHFSSAYEDSKFPKTIKKEVSDWVDAVDKDLKAQFKAHKDDYDWLHDHGFISDLGYDFYKQHGMWISGPPKYSKSYAYSRIQTEVSSLPPRAKADLSDILEGATGAKIQCGCGHGKSYWKNKNFAGEEDGLATEAFAEMIDSTFTCPESVEAIRKYLPKSYSVFEEMLDFLSKV